MECRPNMGEQRAGLLLSFALIAGVACVAGPPWARDGAVVERWRKDEFIGATASFDGGSCVVTMTRMRDGRCSVGASVYLDEGETADGEKLYLHSSLGTGERRCGRTVTACGVTLLCDCGDGGLSEAVEHRPVCGVDAGAE